MGSVIQTVCDCVETLVAHFHLIAATRDTRVVRGDQNVSRNALSADACARVVHSAEVGRSHQHTKTVLESVGGSTGQALTLRSIVHTVDDDCETLVFNFDLSTWTKRASVISQNIIIQALSANACACIVNSTEVRRSYWNTESVFKSES